MQARVLVVLALILASASAGAASVLYKWIGPDGQVHYADVPPKGFTGTVTRIETDPQPASAPPTPVPRASAEERAIRGETPASDLAGQRRATRERLQLALDRARDRLAQARKALDDGNPPGQDEWQVTQQGLPAGPGQVPRSNCRVVDGKTLCPGRVPGQPYYERINRLQAEVDSAQLEVEQAERDYRRGVD